MKNFLCLCLLGTMIFQGSTATLRADALDNWTKQLDYTNYYTYDLTSVAYGGGRYVVVGINASGFGYGGADSGVIMTSDDGVKWIERQGWNTNQSGINVWNLNRVTYANGTFVAVGWDANFYQNLYSSTNGIIWAPHTSQIYNFNDVTYGNGLFVAVGDSLGTTNRNIYTSPDGINWAAQKSVMQTSSVLPINGVAYGAGRFVAVDYSGNFYKSTDGTNWTRSFFGGSSMRFCNGLFVSAYGTGSNLVSADGLSWSVSTNLYLRSAIYASGTYLSLWNTNVFVSNDGSNWTQSAFSFSSDLATGAPSAAFGSTNAVIAGSRIGQYVIPTTFVSDPFLMVSMATAFPPQLNFSGVRKRSYRVDYLDALSSGPANWQPLGTFSLTNSPLVWIDTTATNSQRFYRGVLLP